MEFLSRFKNALFLLTVLLAQALALAVQVRSPVEQGAPDGPSVRLVRMWASAMVTPFERAANAIGFNVSRGWSDYIDLRHVRQQNKDLEQQLTRMRIEQAAIAEDALEGRRLQKLLAFRERYVASTVPAQVIGTSGSEQSRVLTIDKGSRDGLKPDMAVITPNGIVGKLRDVFPTTAQVLEIDDPTSGAGVILTTTRIRAILRGTVTGHIQISNLTADSRIKLGETVITSGGDQVYPRGLPVGTITSIAPDPDHQPYMAIGVKPAVDLDRVEEVLVITGTQPTPPALAQQDLAAAETQHEADINAERLPSIAAPLPPGAPGATSSAPGSPVAPVVPHPLPILHPDRYTSGETPPAVDMTPGVASPPNPPPASASQSQPRSRQTDSPAAVGGENSPSDGSAPSPNATPKNQPPK